MVHKQVNLNVEAKEEELDLTLELENNKVRRPPDGSPESRKRKRIHNEVEKVSSGLSLEDKFTLLMNKIEDLEKLFNHSGR